MKAAVLVEPKRIEIRQLPAPHPGAGQVTIEPRRLGICGSDVSFYQGHRAAPYPWVLGHELVGHITALGESVTNLHIGQRVIVEPNYPCGVCAFCRSGRGAICPNKTSMGVTVPGCFAESCTAPAEFVWPLPSEISDADAATLEPLAVSLHALRQSGARLGDTIAVVGCGATGLLLIHCAVAQRVRVLAHDKFPSKLEMARALGASTPSGDDTARVWREANVTTVFECAGASPSVELALNAAPRGSQVILLGLSASPASFVPLRLVREGLRVSSSLIYDHPSDFARAIALVENGTLYPARIVSDVLPFADMDRALQLASTGQSGKINVEV